MGNLCNLGSQPSNELAWQQKPNITFNNTSLVGRSPVVIKQNIVLSPWDDGCLMLYHLPTQKWSQKPGAQPFKTEWHAVCKTDDDKTIYLYEGERFEKLFVIDTDNMTKYDGIPVGIHSGSKPLIFQDPTKKKCIHLIGGASNKKHYIINTENGTNNCLHTFDDTFFDAAIVHLASKKISVLIHGSMPLHIWDHNTSTWRSTDIETPHEVNYGFAYVVTKDERYAVFMGGSDKMSYATNAVHLLDTRRMEFIKVKGEAPSWTGMQAAITDAGDIHVFSGTDHYVINISEMIKQTVWVIDLGPAHAGNAEEEKETEFESKEKGKNETDETGSAQ